MRRIIFQENQSVVNFSFVRKDNPIWAYKNGELVGMIVKSNYGWWLCLGGATSYDCFHRTLWGCLESCSKYGYDFFTE